MRPADPATQVQPLKTFNPLLKGGQETGAQLPEENGNVVMAVMLPWVPATHEQPRGTLMPTAFEGQIIGAQEPE